MVSIATSFSLILFGLCTSYRLDGMGQGREGDSGVNESPNVPRNRIQDALKSKEMVYTVV